MSEGSPPLAEVGFRLARRMDVSGHPRRRRGGPRYRRRRPAHPVTSCSETAGVPAPLPGPGNLLLSLWRRLVCGGGARRLVAQSVEGHADNAFELSGLGEVDHRDPADESYDVVEARVCSRGARLLGSPQQRLTRGVDLRTAGAEDLGVMAEGFREGAFGGGVADEAVQPADEGVPGGLVGEVAGGAAESFDLVDVDAFEQVLAGGSAGTGCRCRRVRGRVMSSSEADTPLR